MMALQQLRVLLAIKEHGSLTRAAAALHYGVPTVTHHLNSLEAQLQVQLVDRNKRGAQLTEIGTALATDAVEILGRIAQAERRMAVFREMGVATLVVGTFPSVGSRLLPPAIRAMQATMTIRVEVIEAEPTKLVELLVAGDIHGALIYDLESDPTFVTPNLEFTTLMSEPFRVMVGAGSEFAAQDTIDVEALRDHPWIFSRNEQEASQRVLRRVSDALYFEPVEFMRTDDLNMIHGFVASELAVAMICPSAVIESFDVVTRSTTQELGKRRLSYATRRDAPRAASYLGESLVANAVALDPRLG